MTTKTNSEKMRPDASALGVICRRDFMCKSVLLCSAMGAPTLVNSEVKKTGNKDEKSDVKPVDLASYCGLYCGACDIYQKRIGNSGKELKEVLDAFGFANWANQVPGLEDYETFEKVLTNIMAMFGACPTCYKGGGDPACKIRICAKEKGYKTCAECDSFPCEKLKQLQDSYPNVTENIKKIKEIGLEMWAEKQQEKVDNGFRLSTYLAETKKNKAKE